MESTHKTSAKTSFFSRIFGRSTQPPPQSSTVPPSLRKQANGLFLQFSELPVELQVKILRFFVQLPPSKGHHKRHTRLYISGYERQPDGLYIQTRLKWTRCVDVAAAMRTCHLSRELAIAYCLSLEPVGNIECPYEENTHLSEFGHKLPQFGDASTAPSTRSYDDLVVWAGKSPFEVSAMPCIIPETVLGTVRFLIVGEEYLKKHWLKGVDAKCSLNN